jgi:beta-lactamase class A
MRRRQFLAGLSALPLLTGGALGRRPDRAAPGLEALRARLGPGARLGVAAWDGRSGLSLDPDGRYAMASTFKLPLAAAMLDGAERGTWRLDDAIAFDRSDLVPYAPVIEARLAAGRLTISELCAAIVEVSDNAAANLLLRRIGGPAALTAFVRRCGDEVTRLDRFEPELNSNLLGDLRDTTSPYAITRLTHRLLFGRLLSEDSRGRLLGWMERCSTGRDRLRGGLPAGWRSGDKTGTGANGAHNDVAFVAPPQGRPIVIASYMSGGDVPNTIRAELHRAVAQLVTAELAAGDRDRGSQRIR